MPEFEFTSHAIDMLNEREILEEWVLNTIDDPDQHQLGGDNNMHYVKSIFEKVDEFCMWS